MKRFTLKYQFILLAILLLATSLKVFAGDIWFITPTNGQIVNVPVGQSTASIYIGWNWTPSPNSFGTVVKIRLNSEWLANNSSTPIWRTESVGSHSYHAELWEYDELLNLYKTAETSISFTILSTYNVIVKNSFSGGDMVVDGITQYSVPSEGVTFQWQENSTHTITAMDNQNISGYVRIFNQWQKAGSSFVNNLSTTTDPISGDVTYSAYFRKQYNVTMPTASYI